MKTDAEYVLEASIEALEKHIKDLDSELDKLDPLSQAVIMLRFAEIKGVHQYMKKRYEEITNESK